MTFIAELSEKFCKRVYDYVGSRFTIFKNSETLTYQFNSYSISILRL